MKLLSICLTVLFVAASSLATSSASLVRGNAEGPSVADIPSATTPRKHVVTIREFVFEPAELRVSLGDTVVFVNEDVVPHTATADDRTWDSGLMKHQDVWELRVDANTAESYFCLYHPNMKATLQIVDP